MAATVTTIPRSIQGEAEARRAERQGPPLADLDTVDSYVKSTDDYILECRERGRHQFPAVRRARMKFTDVTPEGLLVRVLLCESCQLVQRVEFWHPIERPRQPLRWELVTHRLSYLEEKDEKGNVTRRYLSPAGSGRMTPSMLRDAVATAMLQGRTAKQLRQEVIRQRREREAARLAVVVDAERTG